MSWPAWGSVLGLSCVLLASLPSCRTNEEVEEVALDSGGTAAMDYGQCEPGQMLPCTCANGASGEQLCLDSGYERSACMCDSAPPPPETTGQGSDGTTGQGSDASGEGSSGGGSGSSGTGPGSSGTTG